MTKQEFIEQIEEIGDFELYNIDSEDEITVASVDVKISFNDDDTFNIWRVFCYPIYDYEENFENEYQSILQEETVKQLDIQFNLEPSTEDKCGYGCPFDDSLVGYWNKPFDIDFISKFISACEVAEGNVNEESVANLINETILEKVVELKLSKIDDYTFINKDKTVIVFAKEISCINFSKLKIENLEIVEYPITTINYLLGKTKSGKVIAVNKQSYQEFFSIYNRLRIEKSDFDYFSDNENYLYIKGMLSAIIQLEPKADTIVDGEYMSLIRRIEILREIKPEPGNYSIDFSHLDANSFENLCYDILVRKGFINVHPVGKTNAADGGKDILATEEYKTLIGTEQRKWVWQCKHSKKSLNRKDVSEINDILEENDASAYGLFCTNSLTPDLINRLELKKSSKTIIAYYGLTELKTLLSQHPDIISKYKLLGGSIK